MTAILSYFNLFFEAFVLLSMIAITVWRREFFFYAITALLCLFIALDWIHTYLSISIPLIALSMYFLSVAVLMPFGLSWDVIFKAASSKKSGGD